MAMTQEVHYEQHFVGRCSEGAGRWVATVHFSYKPFGAQVLDVARFDVAARAMCSTTPMFLEAFALWVYHYIRAYAYQPTGIHIEVLGRSRGHGKLRTTITGDD